MTGAFLVAAATAAAVFNDRMVLQRERPVPVWGMAAPSERVKVSFAGQDVTGVADGTGRWRVDLRPMKASKEGRDLVISSANQTIGQSNNRTIFHDVLVGEVWFASGQSNMELPIWGVSPHRRDEYGAQVVQTLRNPYVRYAKTANYKWSETPKADFAEPVVWKDFTKENLLNQRDEWGRGTFSAIGVYYALELYHALDVPVGVIGAYWGGTRIEPWIPKEGFDSITNGATLAARKRSDAKQNACVLWNEQVAPWAPFAIRGVIWYQGCTNVGDSGDYCGLMHALYNGWSKAFGRNDLKLYFVQLAPYRYDGKLSDDFPLLQEAQEKFAAEEPNAGMVVTSDVGNPEDCHPNRKLVVAKRLSLLALKRDYGFDDIVADSPTLRSWKVEAEKFVLSFDHVTRWSMYSPDFSVDSGFEVAGTNGVWRPAELVNLAVREKGRYQSKGFVNGCDLVVAAKDVPQPVRLRYLHREPWYGALQNEVGLPLGPFHVEKQEEK